MVTSVSAPSHSSLAVSLSSPAPSCLVSDVLQTEKVPSAVEGTREKVVDEEGTVKALKQAFRRSKHEFAEALKCVSCFLCSPVFLVVLH